MVAQGKLIQTPRKHAYRRALNFRDEIDEALSSEYVWRQHTPFIAWIEKRGDNRCPVSGGERASPNGEN